MTKTKRR